MKNKFFITLIAVSVFVTVVLFACKKKEAAAPPNITVGFHFHSWVGGTCLCVPFPPDTYVQDSLGRWIVLTEAEFYINNIAIHVAGNWVSIPGQVILKRLENELYPLTATIPQGAIDSVRYTVGLGNALNMQQPSDFSTTSANDSVLSSIEQTAMWGSGMPGMSSMAGTSGYSLMNLQGLDSIGPGNIVPFSYQVGGYGDTVNVALGYPGGFNFVPVQPSPGINLIHMVLDYGKLLQLAVPTFTPGTNGTTNSTFYGTNPAPANAIFNVLKNYPNEYIFHWECTPPINC